MDGNDVPSMSAPINAEEALDRARGYMNKAGYAFYFIEEVKREEPNWVVRIFDEVLRASKFEYYIEVSDVQV
jgi:hypothetical protein